jgi:hypothetical protein
MKTFRRAEICPDAFEVCHERKETQTHIFPNISIFRAWQFFETEGFDNRRLETNTLSWYEWGHNLSTLIATGGIPSKR